MGNSIEDLKWVRVFTPVHVPKYLVEQVRDREYKVDDFYKYQESACIRMTKEGPTLNPLNHLWVLVNKDNLPKGFAWFTVNSLSKDIFINTFSMDKEYWFKGKAVEKLADFIKEIKKKGNLNKVLWVTNYPKHSLRHGFKRSSGILMEYTEEEEDGKDNDGRDYSRGEHRSSEPSTTRVFKRDIQSTGDRPERGKRVQPVPATV